MVFYTISQYFNRLYSILFLLLMAPLLAFTAIYIIPTRLPDGRTEAYMTGILSVVVLNLFLAKTTFDKKIKSARNAQGLGTKLDKYFRITIVRYSLISGGSLLLALALYLTGNDWFAAAYVFVLLLSGWVWPLAGKVCRDLKLKGDEREMVYFKKDNL